VRAIQEIIKLDDLPAMLNDLIAIRIFEPSSKLRSLELLAQFFGVSHSRKTYYKIAPDCVNLKKTVEQKAVCFAGLHYSFKFDILFYDVTTLYFETFDEDELCKNGFSKDNKSLHTPRKLKYNIAARLLLVWLGIDQNRYGCVR